MTPERLGACLKTIRWAPTTLAQSLEVENNLVDKWLSGSASIPMKVASWVEALCFTHEASDLMRPSVSGNARHAKVGDARSEHIPAYSYGLLRQINQGPVALRNLFGTDDEAAVVFLVSRGLAERDGDALKITPAGSALGAITAPPAGSAVS
jgi:hypothetical protein